MLDLFKEVVSMLTNGGTGAIFALMSLIIAWLVNERVQLLKELAKSLQQTLEAKEAEKQVILEIVEKYHNGNLSLVQAINEIKLVLASIQGRIN